MTAVFFDLDDTLYNQLQPFQVAYNRIFPDITEISILELFKKSREYSDRVFTQTESGGMSLETMHRYRMIHAFNDFGYKITAEEADSFQKIYKEQQYKVSLVPEMKGILNYLSTKGISIYIATNGPATHQRLKIEALGISDQIPFGNIFISSEIGYAKPQKAFFEYINAQTNTTSTVSYMVGDSFENDMVGAIHAGWKSIWLNTKNRVKNEHHIKPHYEANSYRKLEEIIRVVF